MKRRLFLGLGSNLGNREAALAQALEAIRQHPDFSDVRVSSLYETQSVGAPGADYLNAIAGFETSLDAAAVFCWMMQLESLAGRVRTLPNAPRTLDIDLLFYGSEVFTTPELTVPHPRLHQRAFVLVPLCEIAPEWIHPVFNQSVQDLVQALSGSDMQFVRQITAVQEDVL